MTNIRTDWLAKMNAYLGYSVVEGGDDEGLRAFNSCIKGIIQSERQRKKKRRKAKYEQIKNLKCPSSEDKKHHMDWKRCVCVWCGFTPKLNVE